VTRPPSIIPDARAAFGPYLTGFPRFLPGPAAQRMHLVDQLRWLQAQPAAAQRRIQQQQLGRLFRHAAAHSPFWRARLPGAVRDGRLRLEDLPVLTRADLRDAGDAARALPPGYDEAQLSTARTSGSTGVPVTVQRPRNVHSLLFDAITLLEHRWHGLDAAKPRAIIKDLPERDLPHWDGMHALFGPTGPTGVRNLLRRAPEELLAWLRGFRPAYMLTTPAMALRLAELSLAAGGGPPIDKLFCFGEVVTPRLREAARAAFGARIIDRYSCEELGYVALQCPKHDHLHVLGGSVLLEVVDEKGRPVPAGVPGRVLLTGLITHYMPLIRYEIGDIGELGPPCDCGIHLPVLKRIIGRTRHFLRLPDGSERIAGLTGEHWRQIAPVEEFRMIQYGDGLLEAFLRCARRLTEAERTAMVAMLHKALGHALPVVITEVERIDWGGRWKREEFMRVDRLREPAGSAP